MKRTSVSGVYSAKRSAQGYLCAKDETTVPSGAFGSACGAATVILSPNPNLPLVARLAVQATNNHPFRRFSSDGDISFPVGGFQKKFRLINKITTEQ